MTNYILLICVTALITIIVTFACAYKIGFDDGIKSKEKEIGRMKSRSVCKTMMKLRGYI